MKKINFLLAILFLFGSTLVFTSCTEEEVVEPEFPEVQMFTGKTLTFVTTNLASSTCMVDAKTGSVIAANGDATKMDIAFAWNSTVGNYSVVSPNAQWIKDLYSYNNVTYSTTDKKTTSFQKLSGVDFTTVDAAYVDGMTVTSSTITGGGNGVQGLATGDLIAFQTADGLKGVIKIGTLAKVTKTLSVDITVQVEEVAAK